MGASTLELEATATGPKEADTADITMKDVVESATLELERRNERLGPLQQEQQQHKTPFEWFEDHDKSRIVASERVGLDRLRMDEDGTASSSSSSEASSESWGGMIDPSEIVSWTDLKELMQAGLWSGDDRTDTSSIISDDSIKNRARDLHRLFEDSGGYIVVELDEEGVSTVEDMWATMEAYFSLPPDKLNGVSKQMLEKEDGSHDPQAGYHFQQTYMNKDGEILPDSIQNALRDTSNDDGSNPHLSNECSDDLHRRGVEDSYRLFAEMCKTVGTIIAAGALEKDLVLMDRVTNSMLNGRKGHPFVNAEHRLSRYILSNNDSIGGVAKPKESLISHTDWTFMTCIPLSAIPGLQLWKPQEQEWIVPEAILGKDERDERTKYVVVMAGKWIELLTDRKITSCVHRVVTQMQEPPSPTGTPRPRLSAPFFCRTKRSIFEMARDEFNESWDRSRDVPQELAIDHMGRFFGDWIRFLEGDRDPTIPGCVLDLCLDEEEYAPGCYSIEEILAE